ncbi:MAG: hypothetical protein ABUS54_10180, partial [Actinomycetota bacterium]
PSLYVRRVLNPAYVYLHKANGANEVAGGVTSPRKTSSGMAPLAFMQGMRAAHAKLDAYAQNPYPGSPRETPYVDPCSWCRTFTMAHLTTIRADVTRYFGASTPIWLTEYGYQTNPPDRLLGVSPALQAAYIDQAALRVYRQAGVTMLINFMVRDDSSGEGWQSGFFTAGGTPKPSYRAFGLPLAQVSRTGTRTIVWGEVRPGSGRRTYMLERWTGTGWATVGGAMRTNAVGAFQRTIAAHAGQKLRVVSPSVGYPSVTLRIS